MFKLSYIPITENAINSAESDQYAHKGVALTGSSLFTALILYFNKLYTCTYNKCLVHVFILFGHFCYYKNIFMSFINTTITTDFLQQIV